MQHWNVQSRNLTEARLEHKPKLNYTTHAQSKQETQQSAYLQKRLHIMWQLPNNKLNSSQNKTSYSMTNTRHHKHRQTKQITYENLEH